MQEKLCERRTHKVLELLSTFSLETIIIILFIGIPALFKLIGWCKNIYKEREQFKQENVDKGKAIEKKEEQKEARLTNGEARMTELEKDVHDLKIIAERQQELIELLITSDELDIKSWIKMQHEKWIPRQCIDSQTLDLLAQRFEIYEQEGGNSWAEKLVNELKALPVVTVIPVAPRDQD